MYPRQMRLKFKNKNASRNVSECVCVCAVAKNVNLYLQNTLHTKREVCTNALPLAARTVALAKQNSSQSLLIS